MIDPLAGFFPLLEQAARNNGARVFARFLGVPLRIAELERQAKNLAAAMRGLGLRPGERVGVMLRNSPPALITLFGLARAGLVWVPLNVQQKGEGLRYIVEHSKPRAVIIEDDLQEVLGACGADLGNVRMIVNAPDGGAFAAMFQTDAAFDAPLPQGSAPFAINYTSGTTGPPKGIVLTHTMLRYAGEATVIATQANDGDVLFMWEPLYHIGGAQTVVLPLLKDVHLAMVDRFSASRFWDQVRETGATHVHYLGGILQILMKQPARPNDRDHAVRLCWGGGCPRDIWQAFEDRFGVTIRECYGMTEASSFTTTNLTGALGSVGRAMPWLSVDVRDGEGQPVATGVQGEIVVRAKKHGTLFDGYLGNPEATAKTLRNGALHTGDLGSLDADGNLYFHGRMTDSVRCRGENVSAWEVERIVATHPAVEECAVIGVASDIGEQDIKLFVKIRADAQLDFPELANWLKPQLAAYQIPRYFVALEDFERTPSQRIMKGRLSRETSDSWDRTQRA